jgi:Fur family peroxide stress response transcriptional regulator
MESPDRSEILINKLKQRGYRLTPQRAAIIQALALSNDHPSAEQVYSQIKKQFPMMSLATVYKTIALLKGEGEILELGFANNKTHYDGNAPYPHPHLICVRCHSIIDVKGQSLDELVFELVKRYSYRLVTHRLDIYGICPQCLAVTNNAI